MNYFNTEIIRSFYNNCKNNHEKFEKYILDAGIIESKKRKELFDILSDRIPIIFSYDILHDAKIKMNCSKKQNDINIIVQNYLFDVCLIYKNIHELKCNDYINQNCFNDSSCLYDELYCIDGKLIIHNYLFDDFKEINIVCEKIDCHFIQGDIKTIMNYYPLLF